VFGLDDKVMTCQCSMLNVQCSVIHPTTLDVDR
jgi:hypothetical protein